MVLFSLEVRATIDSLKTVYTSSDFSWFIKVKCTGCNEVSPHFHAFTCKDKCESKGGRGSFNFVNKCKFCSREGTMSVVEDSINKLTFSDNSDYLPLAKFDCRGLEPIEFSPMEGWIAETSTGSTFNDIDLKENEWVGWDEEGKEPVGIYDFESRFVRA